MLTRRKLIVGAPLTLLLSAVFAMGCSKRESSGATPPNGTPSDTSPELAPSAPVDPAFTGCARSCGSRSAKDRAEVRAQPGAAPGDAVHCPVSGAVFRITETTLHRESRGRTLYFCCETCAAWFTQHEAEVLAKRRLT